MTNLDHRDMTAAERAALLREARLARAVRPGWSSTSLAVVVLVAGSFAAGFLLFGLPVSWVLGPDEGTGAADLALFAPPVLTTVVGGTWSVVFYLRGSWRVSQRLLDDLDYGRVEVVAGTVREAWVVDDPVATSWLLDLGGTVLVVGPPATRSLSPNTFPGRRVELVRCKHSGLVLRWETDGPALAPTARLRREEPLGIESARFAGNLGEVGQSRLQLAA